MEGKVVIIKNGEVVNTDHNIITFGGITHSVELINGNGAGVFKWMAVGTGSTAPSSSQTGLVAQIDIVGTTNTESTTVSSNDTAVFQATFSFTTTYVLREAGLFSSSSAGVMLARRVFSGVSVVNGDSVSVIWSVRL